MPLVGGEGLGEDVNYSRSNFTPRKTPSLELLGISGGCVSELIADICFGCLPSFACCSAGRDTATCLQRRKCGFDTGTFWLCASEPVINQCPRSGETYTGQGKLGQEAGKVDQEPAARDEMVR